MLILHIVLFLCTPGHFCGKLAMIHWFQEQQSLGLWNVGSVGGQVSVVPRLPRLWTEPGAHWAVPHLWVGHEGSSG